jgi:hypothetical protein
LDRQRHGALFQKPAQACLNPWNGSLTLNFSKAKFHKAAVAEKVDLPACPDIAKRPRGIKGAQSHFFVSVLQKETPMSLPRRD